MKVTLGGKTYDSDAATKLAANPTFSSSQELHQTTQGDFFLLNHQIFVDGKRLGSHELWLDLTPLPNNKSRLTFHHEILPLTDRDALSWCARTQIPAPLRGYFLDCL